MYYSRFRQRTTYYYVRYSTYVLYSTIPAVMLLFILLLGLGSQQHILLTTTVQYTTLLTDIRSVSDLTSATTDDSKNKLIC